MQRTKYRLNVKKFIAAMLTILGSLMCIYMVICYMDIVVNNLGTPANGDWNLLVKFIQYCC